MNNNQELGRPSGRRHIVARGGVVEVKDDFSVFTEIVVSWRLR